MSAPKNSFVPRLEGLEERVVPASAVYLRRGDLIINGTGVRNVVQVHTFRDHTGTRFYQVFEQINGVRTSLKVFREAQVWGKDIFFYGNAGNDQFTNSTALRSTAYGGWGNDIIYGGTNNDYLDGGGGNDYIAGFAGNDTILGGTGRDDLGGMDGRDVIDGGDDGAADFVSGGSDADRFQIEYFWSGGKRKNRDQPRVVERFDTFYDRRR